MTGQNSLFKLANICTAFKTVYINRPMVLACQQMYIRTSSKEKVKDLNIPDKPKKPATPYLRYFGEQFQLLRKQNSEVKLTDVAKKCSVEWKQIADNTKQKYEEAYKKDLEHYSKLMVDYNSKLTDEQKTALKEISKEKSDDKKKRQKRKLNKETGKPKRPISPPLMYILQESRNRNIKMFEAMQQLKGKWQTLPESEKAKYTHQYEVEKQRYEKELKEWEGRMIEKEKELSLKSKEKSQSSQNKTKNTNLIKNIEASAKNLPKSVNSKKLDVNMLETSADVKNNVDHAHKGAVKEDLNKGDLEPKDEAQDKDDKEKEKGLVGKIKGLFKI